MRSLLLVSLLLAPSSLVFGQAESVPSENSSSREGRMEEYLKQIDANHDGQIDAEEIQALGQRAIGLESIIRKAGLEPKYPIKISDIQTGMQNARTNGGQAVAESPKEPPKFKNLKEILEAMPRKPEKGDNIIASKMANQWLQSNAIGSVIQFSGRLSSINSNADRGGSFVELSLQKQGQWEGCEFDLRASAKSVRNVNLNDFSKIVQGEMVTLEGKILYLEMRWEKGNGTIQLQMTDCKLISVNTPEATEGFTKTGGGTLVISGSNTYTGEAEASKPTPAKTKINTGTTTVSGGILAVQKAGKFWTYATENGEYAVRLDEVSYVQLLETKSNNPMNWHIFIHLKTKDSPILLDFKEKDKAHAVYQSLLQALESGSGGQVIEGIGKNPEADVRGTVRIPSEKPKPPEEKKEKSLFD